MSKLIFIIPVLLLAAAVPAGPATAPSAADFSSPLATWRTNKAALQAGDAALLKRCYHTTDPAERKAIDAMMDACAVQRQLQLALAEKFGQATAERLAGGFNLEVPKSAREEVRGDQGTLYGVGGAVPTRLVRVDGNWLLTYPSLVDNNFRDLPPLPPDALVKLFRGTAEMNGALLADVQSGKLATAEAFAAARDQRRQAQQQQMREIIKAAEAPAPADQ